MVPIPADNDPHRLLTLALFDCANWEFMAIFLSLLFPPIWLRWNYDRSIPPPLTLSGGNRHRNSGKYKRQLQRVAQIRRIVNKSYLPSLSTSSWGKAVPLHIVSGHVSLLQVYGKYVIRGSGGWRRRTTSIYICKDAKRFLGGRRKSTFLPDLIPFVIQFTFSCGGFLADIFSPSAGRSLTLTNGCRFSGPTESFTIYSSIRLSLPLSYGCVLHTIVESFLYLLNY